NPAPAVLLLCWIHERIPKPGSLPGRSAGHGATAFRWAWSNPFRRIRGDRSHRARPPSHFPECALPQVPGPATPTESPGRNSGLTVVGVDMGAGWLGTGGSYYRGSEGRLRSCAGPDALRGVAGGGDRTTDRAAA